MSNDTKKKRKWIVTSAWPYVNATPHLGNMIGSVLSADVFARYVRLKGDEVVFVSGSDEHGTPIAVEAIKLGIESEDLASQKHKEIVKIFKDWNISYDNYTHTHTDTHINFVQNFYKTVQKNGYVVERESEGYFCPEDDFFLPDRFIEGRCPECGFEPARGDQCDGCGKILEPKELIDPYCKICRINDPNKNTVPELKKTTHWYMDFPKVQEKIRNFIDNNDIIPPNARQMCLNSIEKGLPIRAITRDLKWGIPAPFKGADNKTIYVWFEAVLGYISAVKEWAEKIKQNPELFEYFWNDQDTKAVYFIGKDNIIFHLMVFPGILYAYNDKKSNDDRFVLPYNVSSTEFLMYENDKFSKSRGVGIWTDEALELMPVDYWRYSLIRHRPEGRDVSFIWSEFQRDVDEMNDKIGNFIHRAFTFIYKKFDGTVPPIVELDDEDKKIVEVIKNSPKEVGELLENFKLKEALSTIVEIATKGNVYLNQKAPWKLMKTDRGKAGQIFNICANLSRSLAILLAPICPESAETILQTIGCTECLDSIEWDSAGDLEIKAGQEIKLPKPVFSKIDLDELFTEIQKIRKNKGQKFEIPESLKSKMKDDSSKNQKSKKRTKKKDDHISYGFFKKFKFSTLKISDIKRKAATDEPKTYQITGVSGSNQKISFSTKFDPRDDDVTRYIGKNIICVENLKKDSNSSSNGELLVLKAQTEKGEILVISEDSVPPGSKIL